MAKWVTFAKKILTSALSFFIFFINLIIVCIIPRHALSAGGRQISKNAAWSRMSNFFKPGSDEKNLGQC